MGDVEAGPSGSVESLVKYHPGKVLALTYAVSRYSGQCQVGSLTGAVASQKVTEARKGSLRLNGNQSQSANAKGSLTARPTSRAETKVGVSDPMVLSGKAMAQRIKATPGITG